MEAITGQFTFGRATEYNSLALAQYTWNASLPVADFRKLAVGTLYGAPAGVDLVAAQKLYEETAAAYVRLHLNAKQLGRTPAAIEAWRDAGARPLADELAVLKSNLERVGAQLRRAANGADGIEALRLRGGIHDTRILGLEIELRRKVLEAFLSYQAAARSGDAAERRGRIGESSRSIEEARRLCWLVEQERAERGLLVVAPLSYTPRQTAAVEKLAGIVSAAVQQVHQGGAVPPNRWEEGDLLWRRYLVW